MFKHRYRINQLNAYIGSFRSLMRFKKYLSSSLPAGIASAHRRRARENNSYGSYTHNEVIALVAQSENHCYWCGTSLEGKTFHLDHHIPLSLGGPNIIENLNISCANCNLSKGAQNPLTFAIKKGISVDEDRINTILRASKISRIKYESELLKHKKNHKQVIIKIK